MVPADEYSSKRSEKPEMPVKPSPEQIPEMTGSGLKKEVEGDDVKLMKLYDKMVKARGAKQLKEQKRVNDLQSRLKPILGSYVSDSKDLLKNIPKDKLPQAEFILSVLTRLPKVSLNEKRLLIDGEAMSEPVDVILRDILESGIFGVRSLIQRLRTKDEEEEDSTSAFESFGDTMHEFMKSTKKSPVTSTPNRSGRPSRLSRAINSLQQQAQAQAAGVAKTEEEVDESSPQKVLGNISKAEKSRMRLRENAKGRSRGRSRSRHQRGNGGDAVKWEAY